jgi:Tol biopolymer transport system component
MKKQVIVGIAIASLTGCAGNRLVNFPVDPLGGNSLNSSYAEMTPRTTGRYVVYASDRKGNQDIFLYDTVEKRQIELPGLNALDTVESSPSVTEDGTAIVFAGSRQGRSGIYLYDRRFRQLRNLTERIPAEVRNPMISADGGTIVFESNLRGQWDIQVYNRFGQPLPGLQTEPR